MTASVQEIEKAITQLTEEELIEFRSWFTEYDEQQWDQQISQDTQQGKLSKLAEQALKAHQKGQSTRL
ncbi:hypothetical protein [Marinospirillum sp.]|uniref:hypothetical protein n=1 Tax=Marinospirillum sp. TaxID=2183934 RepID=UPI00286FBCEF|nr:hypothetical protein [Marinospirillum sp.]MDR9467068.1 hypothetical protein [Marinospirillum sp.]